MVEYFLHLEFRHSNQMAEITVNIVNKLQIGIDFWNNLNLIFIFIGNFKIPRQETSCLVNISVTQKGL